VRKNIISSTLKHTNTINDCSKDELLESCVNHKPDTGRTKFYGYTLLVTLIKRVRRKKYMRGIKREVERGAKEMYVA